jgi:hypothetical protein
MSKLRLLKVMVQPVFVLDDGEKLVEQVAQAVTVAAEDWPTYATTGFVEAVAALRAQLEKPGS